jgi:hypothetical protein
MKGVGRGGLSRYCGGVMERQECRRSDLNHFKNVEWKTPLTLQKKTVKRCYVTGPAVAEEVPTYSISYLSAFAE